MATILFSVSSVWSRFRLFFFCFILCGVCLTSPVALSEKYAHHPPVAAAKININTAEAELLAEAMTGIGIKKAQAIVAYRKAHGKFKSLEDLTLVKGIGMATVKKNQGKISI